VGTIEPRKNLTRLLTAFERLRAEGLTDALVIVGKRGWLYDDFYAALERSPARPAILFPGFIPDEDLPAIYTGLKPWSCLACMKASGCPCWRPWPAQPRRLLEQLLSARDSRDAALLFDRPMWIVSAMRSAGSCATPVCGCI